MQSVNVCDVVLVSCYELGHEPLGVLTPAGVFDRAGLSARVVDVAVNDFDPECVKNAALVAISTPMHTALRLGTRVARFRRGDVTMEDVVGAMTGAITHDGEAA